jgi:hypothetical protein
MTQQRWRQTFAFIVGWLLLSIVGTVGQTLPYIKNGQCSGAYIQPGNYCAGDP